MMATLHHPITVDRALELSHAPTWRRQMSLRRWYGFLRMQIRVAQQVPRIVTVSESSKRDIVAQMAVRPSQLAVVPVGVDHTLFRPLTEVGRRPGRIMTTASADVPLKGLVPLLEALAKLRTEHDDAELVVVGKPRRESRVGETIERLGLEGSVTFVSGISDQRLVELYAEAAVAVVPSLYEGFSLPAIEAMACGVPLVATTGGALPEVVGTDGDTGLLVPPGDPGALAAALARVLGDPLLAARLSLAGRHRVLERFTWRACAEGTVEHYRWVLEHAGPPGTRVLTVDYERLRLRSGERLLDLGAGGGRHAFEALRRGASVVAVDSDSAEVKDCAAVMAAMLDTRETAGDGAATVGDANELPFPDGAFDRVIAAEVLEHIPTDRRAMVELARVLRPGGTMAVTVPRWLPELVCWALSDDYHSVPGGHIRIYRQGTLVTRLEEAGLRPYASHHAHALHTPYWWLKCLVGVGHDDHPLVQAYHRLLVWDITTASPLTRVPDRLLNPVVGKSLVVYLEKPATR